MNFKNISELKRANKDNGMFFFTRKTMAFFGSKIESALLKGGYFITSEQPPHGARAYTVRQAQDDASIKTVGEFCGHKSKFAAKEAIKKLQP